MKRIAFLTVLFVLAFACYAWAVDPDSDEATVSVTVPLYNYWTSGIADVNFGTAGTDFAWTATYAEVTGLSDAVVYSTNSQSWDMEGAVGAGLPGDLSVDITGGTYEDADTAFDETGLSGDYSVTISAWKLTLPSGDWTGVDPSGSPYSATVTLTASGF